MSSKDPISSKETLVLPDALIGRKVGGYEIRGILGKGGMGVVYRAHDEALDRDVALKLLPPALSADADYSERFIREARMAAKLDHPRIVPVYAAGSSDRGAWIAMQLVKGRTLAEELHDGMRPTFASVVRIARQTAEALDAAHRAGLIHRDIKPGNLIIDAEGNVKVLDFGLARPAKPSGYTQDGTYLGTPEYSSPEQCQTNDIDGRADLYSLGVVMYEMLGGRIPHVAETPLALFTKIVNEEPIALRDLNPKVPPSLAAIVSKLIAKSRDARYADARAVIVDLDKVVVKDGPARTHETVQIGPADRARVAAWTLAGVLATVLVAAVVHSSPWSNRASGSSGGSPAPIGAGSSAQVVPADPAVHADRVVFLDFKNITGNPEAAWLETALPEIVASSLATHDGLNPLDREEVTSAMRRELNARLTSGGGDNLEGVQAQGLKLLDALKAGTLVRGSFVLQGPRVRVMATVLVRRGDRLEVAGRSQVENTIENILQLSDEVAQELAAVLAPRHDGYVGAVDESWDTKRGPRPVARKEAEKAGMVARADKALEERLRKSPRRNLRGGEVGDRLKLLESKQKEHALESEDAPSSAAAPGDEPQETGAAEPKSDTRHEDSGLAAGKTPAAAPPGADPRKGHASEGGTKDEQAAGGENSRNEAKKRVDQLADAEEQEDVLAVLRKFAEEIRESEKDLKEVELGAEGAVTK
ncbi:MAG: protein kinase [Planctomycetia bacterium]|nr:protein kinase [Planctomycetia bacterium]